MNEYDPDKGNDLFLLNGKARNDEWSEIVDRVEAAILMSLANRILADATDKQNQIDEHRRQMKLVEIKKNDTSPALRRATYRIY
jgi:hypothetical protein